MTRPDGAPPPKWLRILDDEEIADLYARPVFTPDERRLYFALSQPEQDSLELFEAGPSRLAFLLQLGYFKAKHLFFSFEFHEVAEDVQYLPVQQGEPHGRLDSLAPLNKRTLLKQRRVILALCGYRRPRAAT